MMARNIGSVTVIILFGAMLLANLIVQQYYVDRSRAARQARSASFTEIPNASGSRLLETLAAIRYDITGPTLVVSDTSNVVLAKIESFFARRLSIVFPSDDFFENLAIFSVAPNQVLDALRPRPLEKIARALSRDYVNQYAAREFRFVAANGKQVEDPFLIDQRLTHAERRHMSAVVLVSGSEQSALNRRWVLPTERESGIGVRSLEKARNHLVFVASRLGESYFKRNIHSTLFQLEPDYYFPNSTMAGLGRYVLLEILNPTPSQRLEFWITDTLKGDGKNSIPPAIAYGTRASPFSVIGRGATRAVTMVIHPRIIDGRAFVLLDMGAEGQQFRRRRIGLMNLYGRNVELDPRRLTCFIRDISLISDREYRFVSPPSVISTFPEDFANPRLFYSGIYEDGWASEAVTTRLSQPAHTSLHLKGLLPLIGDPTFHTTMRVFVDDKLFAQRELTPGYFDFRFRSIGGFTVHDVRAMFDRYQKLPGIDGRPVSVKLDVLGFDRELRSSKSR